jgi:transposase-like protein
MSVRPERTGPSIPGGDHQPLRVAVSPLPAQFPRGEDMMLARGVVVSYETIRAWCRKFGQTFAKVLRRRWPRPSDKRHLDLVTSRRDARSV